MPDPTRVRVELLGGFRALIGGHAAARLPSARQQQLITFLVLHARSRPVARQRIAGSLWPESADAQALTNLRRELHHLREEWPALDAQIDARSRTLAWGGDGATVDLEAFETIAERGLAGDRGALQEAADLYQGDLLPDCTGEWIEAERERLRHQAGRVLAQRLVLLEQDRAYGEAIDAAQQLLRLNPLDESAWCALMRCHARRGERATALHLYQQCAALLKKELGIQPDVATRMTHREILELDSATPALAPPPRTAVYPLVGRHLEWQGLLSAWHAAANGRPALFVIRGEAGIGKTRLAEELVDWCGIRNISAVTARCHAGEGTLAYAPIATWLNSKPVQAILSGLDPSCLSDIARLRPEVVAARADVPAPVGQLESWQRLRFFDALAQAFRTAAPLLLVLDDLQWANADTIEWLQYFLRSAAGTRCLVVGTLRAEEEQDNPPLGKFLVHLEQDGLLTTVSVGPLDREATAQLAGAVAERPLDEAALAQTFHETEGHPLFIVERGRMELSGEPGDAAAPKRVQAVVAARLALLTDEARAAVEVAAAVGRDFRFDILAHASDLEEGPLVRALDELWRRQILRVQADERWEFSHDRIREVAYSGIGPARRRLIHRRIAQGMELLFADRLDAVSASIAVHLDRGGLPARAVPFLQRAATVATRVSASEEAIRCLTLALSLLDRLPAGRDRDELELVLRSTLSVALNSARGYAAHEVEQNLNRVLILSAAAGRDQVPVRWLWAAFSLRFVLGDLKRSREMAEQALARSLTDPTCRCEAHHAMGATLLSTGELEASRQHFEAALAAYDERSPQRSALGSDLGVFGLAWYSHTLWLLGDDSAAVEHAGSAVALAERLDHPYSRALALAYSALLHQMRREPVLTVECAEAVVALCERHGFGYYGDWARVLIGWARGQERPADGVAIMEAAFARLDNQRAQARRPYYLSLLAETHRLAGSRNLAASILDAAIEMAVARLDRWWLPALYLQKGELERPPAREQTLRRGLELARAQKCVSIERRILTSLASESA